MLLLRFNNFALPTNYDDQLNFFDTSVLSDCIEKTLEFNVDVPFILNLQSQ